MLQTNSIREGFNEAHKNWLLIILQLAMSLLLFAGLIAVVAAFILTAIVVLGFDINRLDQLGDWLGTVNDPMELLTNYAGLALGFAFGFLLYSTFAAMIWIFTLGGSAGALGVSITHPTAHISPRVFFSEGRRLFWRVAGLTSLTALFFIAALMVMGLLAGGGSVIWDIFIDKGTRLSVFLAVLMSLIAFSVMIIVMIYLFALTAWGLAEIVFRGGGVMDSVRKAAAFIKERPESFGMLLLAMLLMVLVQVMLMTAWYPISLSPRLGIVAVIPFQIVAYAVQSYVNLALMAAVLVYYHHARVATAGPSTAPVEAAPQAQPHAASEGPAQTSPQMPFGTPPEAHP